VRFRTPARAWRERRRVLAAGQGQKRAKSGLTEGCGRREGVRSGALDKEAGAVYPFGHKEVQERP